MEPRWLTKQMVVALHDESVALFGGIGGVRDEGLLESALDRPRNLLAYEEGSSVFRLAAAHCAGIVRNHPFVDGNKRAGLLALRAFLLRNGYRFEPSETDAVIFIMALAAGELEESELVEWIATYSEPR